MFAVEPDTDQMRQDDQQHCRIEIDFPETRRLLKLNEPPNDCEYQEAGKVGEHRRQVDPQRQHLQELASTIRARSLAASAAVK